MKRALIAALLIGALGACQKAPESAQRAGNDIQVEKLFTVDGCTVYRFDDARTVYFTNCKGSTGWRESCGKSCSRDVDVNGGA